MQDCEAFRMAAHSIKSTSNSFGALQFGLLAKELEWMGRDARPWKCCTPGPLTWFCWISRCPR
jgi:hypothetical protein